PMVFLKQFPSVTDPDKACYQAITTVPIKMTKFHGGSMLDGNFEVNVYDYDSHPVRRDLGFAPGPLNPLLSFYTNFDFYIGNGEVLWEAKS
ncbi:MAG: hypothetical protein AAF492_18530, partial [Verrucomicrobiota bacterium]